MKNLFLIFLIIPFLHGCLSIATLIPPASVGVSAEGVRSSVSGTSINDIIKENKEE
ncbi:hypothetical protein N9T65_00705 [Candidatus Pelagibacter sp.]|nr:hypothetical protein [Candidatus Pelagibacter sp.]MDA9663380.1 hypothetical protein [Candidatus Pelagibacter sp.]